MFDLVADVERYPEFVPMCQSLKVRQRTQKPDGSEVIVADMTVSFQVVRETFTSRVTLDRPNLKILVEYLQGPFSKLENRWTFEAKSEDSCDVGFFIAYEFKSRMLAVLMGAMFDAAFQRFAAAFPVMLMGCAAVPVAFTVPPVVTIRSAPAVLPAVLSPAMST